MAFWDDFSLDDAGAGVFDLRHTSGTTRYSVLELHRAVQDLADDETSTSDDDNDITRPVLSSRQTDRAITLLNGLNIDDATAQFITGGSITQDNGDTLYSGIDLQFLVQPFTADVYMLQNDARVDLPVPSGNAVTDSLSFLVKVKSAGALIDSGDLRFYTRVLGNTGSDLAVNVSGGGSTTVFLGPGSDANVDNAAGATYAAILADLTIAFGSFSFDVNNGNGAQSYDAQVTVSNDRTPLEVFQALQYVTRDGSTVDLNGDEGQFYRIASAGYTPLPATPLASFAGGNITGAQGVYFTGFDAQYAQNFIGTAGSGAVQTPPNTVPISVTSAVSGDRVAVFRADGAAIDTDEFALAAGNDSGDGTVEVKSAIGQDHPQSGFVRVFNGTSFDRYAYSSFSGTTFTLDGVTLSQNYAEDADAFVPFIDADSTGGTLSSSIIQTVAIPVIVRVRNGSEPIVPFETTGTITANGFSIGAIRQSDA